MLEPGWNRVYNDTGGPEALTPVGGGATNFGEGSVVIHVSGAQNPRETARVVREEISLAKGLPGNRLFTR